MASPFCNSPLALDRVEGKARGDPQHDDWAGGSSWVELTSPRVYTRRRVTTRAEEQEDE